MNTRILNAVIVASIIGFVGIFIRDTFVSSANSNAAKVTVTPTVATSMVDKTRKDDPAVPCQHSYFSFDKGTKWTYQTVTAVQTKAQPQQSTDTLTAKVIATQPSAITIGVTSQKSGTTNTTTIECRQSGLYGLPFVISTPVNLVTKSFLIVPPVSLLNREASWNSSLSFDVPIIENISLTLKSAIADIAETLFKGKKRSTMSISSVFTPQEGLVGNILDEESNLIYTLMEGVGVESIALGINVQNSIDVSWSAKLIDFTSGSASVSQ